MSCTSEGTTSAATISMGHTGPPNGPGYIWPDTEAQSLCPQLTQMILVRKIYFYEHIQEWVHSRILINYIAFSDIFRPYLFPQTCFFESIVILEMSQRETYWDLQEVDDAWIVVGNGVNQQHAFRLSSASWKKKRKTESWIHSGLTKSVCLRQELGVKHMIPRSSCWRYCGLAGCELSIQSFPPIPK